MKKYMIRCDMEGASGIVSPEQAEPGRSEYAFGLNMFMIDLLALIEGLQEGGAEEIHIFDEHYYGRNVDLARIPKGVFVWCGKPAYTETWAGGLDGSFAGLILLGLHAKQGTPCALLPHTYEPEILNMVLNGVPMGEIGVEAAVAGVYDVPLLLVTADSAGAAEAEALLPGVATVAVKQAWEACGGLCYPASVTADRIRRAGRGIVENPPPVKPYRISGEATLEVELRDTPFLAEMLKRLPPARRFPGVCVSGSNALEAYARYWACKLQSLSAAKA